MECIFDENLSEKDKIIEIKGDEAKHLKALHAKIGRHVLVTNGSGLTVKTFVDSISKDSFILHSIDHYNNMGELPINLSLAIGILDDRRRFEFAFEKAVELGISEFYPLMCDYSQKDKVNLIRLRAKAISAMKQCKRSRITEIHKPKTINEFIDNVDNNTEIIVADINGIRTNTRIVATSIVVLIGPEGGLSEQELNKIKEKKNCVLQSLGNRRLRSETAAISMLTLNSCFLGNR